METTYRTVNVKDRLPEDYEYYYTDLGKLKCEGGIWQNGEDVRIFEPTEWLEPILPAKDAEEFIKQIAEKIDFFDDGGKDSTDVSKFIYYNFIEPLSPPLNYTKNYKVAIYNFVDKWLWRKKPDTVFAESGYRGAMCAELNDLLTEFSNSKPQTKKVGDNHIVDTNKKVRPLSFEEFCNKYASPTDGTKFEEELRKLKYDGYLIGIQSSNNKQLEEALKFALEIKDLWSASQYGTTGVDRERELQALEKMESLIESSLNLNKE